MLDYIKLEEDFKQLHKSYTKEELIQCADEIEAEYYEIDCQIPIPYINNHFINSFFYFKLDLKDGGFDWFKGKINYVRGEDIFVYFEDEIIKKVNNNYEFFENELHIKNSSFYYHLNIQPIEVYPIFGIYNKIFKFKSNCPYTIIHDKCYSGRYEFYLIGNSITSQNGKWYYKNKEFYSEIYNFLKLNIEANGLFEYNSKGQYLWNKFIVLY